MSSCPTHTCQSSSSKKSTDWLIELRRFRRTACCPDHVPKGDWGSVFSLGLRRIEWVIFGLKTRETWGLRGDFAFYGIWNLSMTDGWHEHRNVERRLWD